jgi:glycosyltransferase involved in cell wall biosynthesis
MISPLFSIIIPVYNAAEYLPPLLKQLQGQTIQDFELIFVNDCSPDHSAEILALMEKEDDRVRVFTHETNRCQGAARNTGLDHARGEYILYIDADDSVPVFYLERLVKAIERSGADLVICNSIWVYQDRKVYRNMFIENPDLPELLITGEESLQRFYSVYKDDIRIPVEPWGRIIRRNMIEKYHMRNPETLHEDVVMCFSELLFAGKVLFLNEYLYYYNRKNTSSVIFERKKQYLRDFPLIFVGIKKVLLDNGLYEPHRRWLTRFYFGLLGGVYASYSKGDYLPDEMYQAILHYRKLLPDPLIEGSEEYISDNLMSFKFEMVRNNIPDIFSLFIEAHPEVNPLIRKKIRYYIMYRIFLLMRYDSVWKLFRRIVIDPRFERRRLIITHILRVRSKIRKKIS